MAQAYQLLSRIGFVLALSALLLAGIGAAVAGMNASAYASSWILVIPGILLLLTSLWSIIQALRRAPRWRSTLANTARLLRVCALLSALALLAAVIVTAVTSTVFGAILLGVISAEGVGVLLLSSRILARFLASHRDSSHSS